MSKRNSKPKPLANKSEARKRENRAAKREDEQYQELIRAERERQWNDFLDREYGLLPPGASE